MMDWDVQGLESVEGMNECCSYVHEKLISQRQQPRRYWISQLRSIIRHIYNFHAQALLARITGSEEEEEPAEDNVIDADW